MKAKKPPFILVPGLMAFWGAVAAALGAPDWLTVLIVILAGLAGLYVLGLCWVAS